MRASRLLVVLVVLASTGHAFTAPPAFAALGDVTEWSTITLGSAPQGIGQGADGALWFAERGADRIGRITPLGAVSEFPAGGGPTSIALGPDGAMWFTEQTANRIGRIATDGTVSEYPLPTAAAGPTSIALGPDGAMWFTARRSSQIGRITSEGRIAMFALTGGQQPTGIAAGPDGALWFTAPGTNTIGRISVTGVVAEIAIPTPNSAPTGITLGPDGAIWFTEFAANRVARIADGAIEEFPLPTDSSGPHGITAGPDDNVWFTGSAVATIGRLELVPPDTTPPAVTIATPAEGSAYLVGQVVVADHTCSDEGGSGLASCQGTPPDGAMLDTSAPGVRTVTVTATDGAGNTTSVRHPYLVLASWDGRLLLPPQAATLRAGQPADLWFGLGGDLGPVLVPGAPFMQQVDCSARTALGPLGPATGLGPGAGPWVAGDRYVFRWRTERSWAGTCRQLVLPFTIQGGTILRLTVRFT